MNNRVLKSNDRDFPGGTVDKNPPTNAGDVSSIPGPWRFHMPQSSYACAPQLLSLRSETWELQQRKPMCPRAHGQQHTKPSQWEAHSQQPEKDRTEQRGPCTAKK